MKRGDRRRCSESLDGEAPADPIEAPLDERSRAEVDLTVEPILDSLRCTCARSGVCPR